MTDAAYWSERLQQALACYDEPLLRRVAARLLKPRNQWPADELIKRGLETIENLAVIDRRLQDLDPAGRRVLALISHSRQPRWYVGNLVELLAALGHADGLQPILGLLEAGLLYPELSSPHEQRQGPARVRCRDFESWLAQTPPPLLTVFAHPGVTARALGEDLGLPDLSTAAEQPAASAVAQEVDGLEWPLRLAVLWQQVKSAPLRLTQQRDFFKRDLDRLRNDPLLSAPPADNLIELPDLSLLAVALGLAGGVLREKDGELQAGELAGGWDEGLPATLAGLWSALPQIDCWDSAHGWKVGHPIGNPYPSAYLLALVLLARVPEGRWAPTEAVARWVAGHHPYWASEWASAGGATPTKGGARRAGAVSVDSPLVAVEQFLLGLAFQLRLLQVTRDSAGGWLVRLAPMGRWVLGLGEVPALPGYAQTLLVQPNLQILVYRQGLTPGLIVRLGRFAAWKGLGAACMLQLEPETVYGALESGESFETILQTLRRHGMKETPTAVVDSLRTWANKRERISVYASAALFEFATAEDLNEALARGLPGVRLSDRVAAVASEKDIDYRHFRLIATRDYTLPPEKCITLEADGVTLSVDMARADLLLESEVQRFAELVDGSVASGRRVYRLTPASLASGREGRLSVPALENWFLQRSGQPLSPAARLLLTGTQAGTLELRRLLVLQVASEEIADGLQQWPGTRALIQERLGPTALVVAEEHVPLLQQRLGTLGMQMEQQSGEDAPS